MNISDDELARTLWNYHYLSHELIPADLIIGLGSNEREIADWAAKLYTAGLAPKILFSGKHTHPNQFGPDDSEAVAFAKIAEQAGVPANAILIEQEATNTKENMVKARELLERRGIEAQRIIVIASPQHSRRAYLTALQQLPGHTIESSPPPKTFEEFLSERREGRIRALVGHTLRLRLFAKKGDVATEEIPAEVMRAYNELRSRGYEPLALEAIREDMVDLGITVDLNETRTGEPHIGQPPPTPLN